MTNALKLTIAVLANAYDGQNKIPRSFKTMTIIHGFLLHREMKQISFSETENVKRAFATISNGFLTVGAPKIENERHRCIKVSLRSI